MWCCASDQSAQTASENLQQDKEEPQKEEEKPPEEPKPKFTISIVGARGIRNSDWMPGSGKPDCFCEVKRKVGGEEELLHKTKTIDNSMMPRWTEEFQVWNLEENETLEFQVYDKDPVGQDYLGKVLLTPDAYAEKGCNTEFMMEEAGKNIKAFLGLKLRPADQAEYPAGPPAEFEVTVQKGDGAAEYGLEIDSQDTKNLQVAEVDKGAFKVYNEKADPSVQVVKSDFIVAVNKAEGDAIAMVKEFQKEEEVTVKFVRAVDTSIVLENNDATKKHGLKFPAKMKKDVLVVMEIGDGYIKEYNDSCTDESQKILPYDRITVVKGQAGTASSLKGLMDKATGKFQVGIQRPCPRTAATKGGGMFRLF